MGKGGRGEEGLQLDLQNLVVIRQVVEVDWWAWRQGWAEDGDRG